MVEKSPNSDVELFVFDQHGLLNIFLDDEAHTARKRFVLLGIVSIEVNRLRRRHVYFLFGGWKF